MNVRNARVEEAVEAFYQPEDFELQLIRANDRALDRGIHRRCVAACCQDTDTFHNWTAKVFTRWSLLARSIYSGERINFKDFRWGVPEKLFFLSDRDFKAAMLCSGRKSFKPAQVFDSRGDSTMEDRTVLIKMAISTLAGLLFFDFAVFTTMLDLPIFWRNIWLGFCITFFVVAVAGVFVLCGDLNSEHSKPEDAKPKES